MHTTLPPKLAAVLHQFIKFATVGAGGAVVHFAVYLGLTRGLPWWREHFLVANLVAFLVSNLHNFLWHRKWTFGTQTGGVLKQYFGFLGVSSFYLIYLESAMWLLVKHFHWHDVVSLLVSVGVGVSLYFLIVKRFIFKKASTTAN